LRSFFSKKRLAEGTRPLPNKSKFEAFGFLLPITTKNAKKAKKLILGLSWGGIIV